MMFVLETSASRYNPDGISNSKVMEKANEIFFRLGRNLSSCDSDSKESIEETIPYPATKVKEFEMNESPLNRICRKKSDYTQFA